MERPRTLLRRGIARHAPRAPGFRERARVTLKRGGTRRRITLDDDAIAVDDQADALLQLDDALARLAAREPRLAKVVELRFFGGLAEDEIAESLGVDRADGAA